MKFPAAPVLLADGPQFGSWQVAVVRVDETPAGDVSERKCPRAEQNRQWPIDVSEVTGNVRPVLPAGGSPLAGVVNPVGPDGPVVAGGPCEMLSPYSEKTQEPLEHALLIQADPAGQSAAVGTLSSSDCYPVGPAGRPPVCCRGAFVSVSTRIAFRDGQYRAVWPGGSTARFQPGNEGWSGREGQPPGPSVAVDLLTPVGGSVPPRPQGTSRYGCPRWGMHMVPVGLQVRRFFHH